MKIIFYLLLLIVVFYLGLMIGVEKTEKYYLAMKAQEVSRAAGSILSIPIKVIPKLVVKPFVLIGNLGKEISSGIRQVYNVQY